MDNLSKNSLDTIPQPLILFDGVCNLCNASVQFIIENDAQGVFHFASLQSDVGHRVLNAFNQPTDQFESVLLLDHGKLFMHSTAAYMIAEKLDSKWRFLRGIRWLPKPLRDTAYRLVAQNRYRLWGKQTHCWLPTPELSKRFL